MKKFAIIVAGGSGKRMGTAIPKQFLLLNNLPIIFHTLYKFSNIADRIVVVLPQDQISYFEELCIQYSFNVPLHIVVGGQERFHSVQNALAVLNAGEGLVAVHDAVRPLISSELIQKSYEEAAIHGNCILAVACKDSIRHVQDNTNVSVPRQEYFLVQTPQVFDLNLLKRAYTAEFINFTDDASVFEHAGHRIHLLSGSYSNIKVTTPEDLSIAEALLVGETSGI